MASCLILTPARIWAHDYREEEQRKGAVFTGKLPSGGGNSSWIFCRTGRTWADGSEVQIRNEMAVCGNSRKTLLPRAGGQVREKCGEGKTAQDGLTELLGSSQMAKEFGPHLTGNGESLKDFEQVEQGKDVICWKGCFQRWSLSAAACSVQAVVGGWEEAETGRSAAVTQGRDRWWELKLK